MSQFSILSVIILSILLSYGHALLDCRDPPAESQAFFDLEELKSLAAKYPDQIQTPVKCSTENGSSTCANQICCEDEIRCCFEDTENNRQICGCKAKTDKTCTRGPPIVYIRTYRCEDHHSAESYTCIRKNKEGEVVEGSVVTSIGAVSRDLGDMLQAFGKTTGELVDGVGNTTGDLLAINELALRNLVDSLSVDQLARMMSTEKLYKLAQEVMEKHAKGIPYGSKQNN